MQYMLKSTLLTTLILSSCAQAPSKREPSSFWDSISPLIVTPEQHRRYSPGNTFLKYELKKKAPELISSYHQKKHDFFEQVKVAYGVDYMEPVGVTIFSATVKIDIDSYGKEYKDYENDDSSYYTHQVVCLSKQGDSCTRMGLLSISESDPKYNNGHSYNEATLHEVKMPLKELVYQDMNAKIRKAKFGEEKLRIEASLKDLPILFDSEYVDKYSYVNRAKDYLYVNKIVQSHII